MLAMALAEQVGGVIISADSRQIYRGFDIGTAKPTPAEQARTPHYGIDLVDPEQRFSAAQWAALARGWMAASSAPALVTGGTGFYIRALVQPLFEEPPLPEEQLRPMRAELGLLPTSELRRWCELLDPARARLGRAQLLRAVEVALLTGVPISHWHRQSPGAPASRVRYLLVDPNEDLEGRIVNRVHQMLSAGWEDEVRQLLDHVAPDAPAWKATGYRTVRELVEGRLTREAAVARIVIDTRQYAKRQRTWFRHQLPAAVVTRIDPRVADAWDQARQWWEHGGTRTT
jgi:tRNA dimethylallyltransferase